MDIGSLSFLELLKLLKDAGPSGFLLLAVVGLARQWWVFGWQYKEKVKEAEEWKAAALAGTGLAETAAEHAANLLARRRKRPE